MTMEESCHCPLCRAPGLALTCIVSSCRGPGGPDVETEAGRVVRAGFKALQSHRSWVSPLQGCWLGASPGAFRHPGVRHQPQPLPDRQTENPGSSPAPPCGLPQSLHWPPRCLLLSPTPAPSLSVDPRSPCLPRWGNSKGSSLKATW